MTCTRTAALLAALCLVEPPTAGAQGLPTYTPINPTTTSRSALYFQPYERPAPAWRATAQLDWASLIEATRPGKPESFLLDAEVLRLELTLVRDYGPANFVLLSASVNGAVDGYMDGFYDWYHDLTGLRVPAREQRPRNEFAYQGTFADGETRSWDKAPVFLGDVKLGLGVRHSPALQTLVFVTLPTTTAGRGYGRGVASANGIVTGRGEWSGRLVYEGSLGFGWTPRHGELEEFQKTTFWSASSGLRLRFWGQQSMFFTGFWQTAGYRDTNLELFDRAELTADMGFIVRTSPGSPELVLALTEDLKPSGPAVDATFRVGLRW